MSLRNQNAAYLSAATLAQKLDCSKATVYVMVERGIIPQPIRLSHGCVRWRWADVDAALASLKGAGSENAASDDPFIEGVRNVTTKAKKGGDREAA